MKRKITYLLVPIAAALLMTACLNVDDDTDGLAVSNAQIASFTLSHDSIDGLSDVKFTIDQLNGLIYNKDSLPLGTIVGKVLCTLQYAATSTGVAGTLVIPQSTGDTLRWNGSDSLDFSQPVHFIVTAYDGLTAKRYVAKVNIHQVNPDSMVWERYATTLTGLRADELKVIRFPDSTSDNYLMYIKVSGATRLFISPDATTWRESDQPLSGLPEAATLARITVCHGALYVSTDTDAADAAVPYQPLYRSPDGLTWEAVADATALRLITLLGAVGAGRNNSPALAAIVRPIEASANSFRFAAMDSSGAWTEGDYLPDNFPLSGFTSCAYSLMYSDYLALAAGENRQGELLNGVWATANGLNWALLSRPNTDAFERRTGAALIRYDNKFCLTGGFNAQGEPLKDLLFSADNGLTWNTDSLATFPPDFPAKAFASALTDNDNFILLFGGKTSYADKHADELWRGRFFRLAF